MTQTPAFLSETVCLTHLNHLNRGLSHTSPDFLLCYRHTASRGHGLNINVNVGRNKLPAQLTDASIFLVRTGC